MDLNPITNDYDYYMYIRHLVTPEQAIAAFSRKHQKYTIKLMTDMNYTVKHTILPYSIHI